MQHYVTTVNDIARHRVRCVEFATGFRGTLTRVVTVNVPCTVPQRTNDVDVEVWTCTHVHPSQVAAQECAAESLLTVATWHIYGRSASSARRQLAVESIARMCQALCPGAIDRRDQRLLSVAVTKLTRDQVDEAPLRS